MTGSNPWPLLVLAVLFGAFGYAAAEQFRRRYGVTPWKWPSFVWGIIGFASLLICAILLIIASRQTRAKVAAGAYGPAPSTTNAPGYGPGPGHGPPPGPPAAPPAGWYPDPGGRHQLRFWDGRAWTAHVTDHGRPGVDPPPAGPTASGPAASGSA